MIKEIKDFPNYLISNKGKIFKKNTMNEIKSSLNKTTGYMHVNLYNKKSKTFQVHRLVAIHFIENPLSKKCVNHKDSNRLNNFASNLEWVTHSENNKHAYDKGYKSPPDLGKFGINNKKSKIVIGLNEMGNRIIFYSLGEAERNRYYRGSIIKSIKESIKYKGFYWSYYC